jgi:hypothetical protein
LSSGKLQVAVNSARKRFSGEAGEVMEELVDLDWHARSILAATEGQQLFDNVGRSSRHLVDDFPEAFISHQRIRGANTYTAAGMNCA